MVGRHECWWWCVCPGQVGPLGLGLLQRFHHRDTRRRLPAGRLSVASKSDLESMRACTETATTTTSSSSRRRAEYSRSCVACCTYALVPNPNRSCCRTSAAVATTGRCPTGNTAESIWASSSLPLPMHANSVKVHGRCWLFVTILNASHGIL